MGGNYLGESWVPEPGAKVVINYWWHQCRGERGLLISNSPDSAAIGPVPGHASVKEESSRRLLEEEVILQGRKQS